MGLRDPYRAATCCANVAYGSGLAGRQCVSADAGQLAGSAHRGL